MDEVQLGHHFVRKYKRIEIGLPHGARHAVEQHGELCPAVQKRQEDLGIGVVGQVEGRGVERGVVELRRIQRQTIAGSGVDRVAHVHVVSPALGPVFPRVHAGVGTDKMEGPVRARAFFIALFQALGVVLVFIAKQLPECGQPFAAGVVDQPVPIVVPDLVAKVPHQGTVRLVHREPGPLPLDIIGFGHVQRDQAIVVTGHHMLAFPGRTQDVEHQSILGVFRLARGHRQPHDQQG